MTYDERVMTYYCGCHGKSVTIATTYVADAYRPIKPPYQIWTQYGLRQRSHNVKCIGLTHWTHKIGNLSCNKLQKENYFLFIILLHFCLHRRFIFDDLLTSEAQRSLFDLLNSIAMCLAEFI